MEVDPSGIASLVFSPDFRQLAIGCNNGAIFDYDVDTGTLYRVRINLLAQMVSQTTHEISKADR